MNKRKPVQQMAFIGVLSALVFVASLLSIPIPTALDNTRLHLGNVMCLLSGLLLGPVPGGLAAGLGSLFFDLTNPLFIAEAPITFVTKFAMAWLCGIIVRRGGAEGRRPLRNFVGAASGALFYVLLYLTKTFVYSYFFLRMEMAPILLNLAQKGAISTINGVIAVVAAVPLSHAVRAALSRSHLFEGKE